MNSGKTTLLWLRMLTLVNHHHLLPHSKGIDLGLLLLLLRRLRGVMLLGLPIPLPRKLVGITPIVSGHHRVINRVIEMMKLESGYVVSTLSERKVEKILWCTSLNPNLAVTFFFHALAIF